MIACIDVDYRAGEAVAACVVFDSWTSDTSRHEAVARIGEVKPYQPGEFYKRELPCILVVLGKVPEPIHAIVVDGYVWLGDSAPGLGARLYEALKGTVPVIGVAKSRFKTGGEAATVYRGRSQRPLFVTAAGMPQGIAAQHIECMHGRFRIPTMLKRVDQLCRQA